MNTRFKDRYGTGPDPIGRRTGDAKLVERKFQVMAKHRLVNEAIETIRQKDTVDFDIRRFNIYEHVNDSKGEAEKREKYQIQGQGPRESIA